MRKIFACLALASVFLGGCATIVGDRTQLIPISSTPSDATVLITDEKGAQIFKGETPTTVTLRKSDGSYWGGKDFTVRISKAGYETQVIPVTSNPNGWYIGGNLIFGGLIGWFIVDPLTGAMYTLTPEQVSATLGGSAAHNNTGQKGSISIVLLEDVPAALKGQMTKVN
jgi:hypothetical protein